MLEINVIDGQIYQNFFNEKSFVQIDNILHPNSANLLLDFFQSQKDWNLALAERGKHKDINYRDYLTWPEQQKQLVHTIATNKQETSIQYLYRTIPVFDIVKSGSPAAEMFAHIHDLVNCDQFIDTMRAATGLNAIQFADCQITAFDSGHFLKIHDDNVADKNRLAAYVINLTPNWKADWGGHLNFYDTQGNITAGLIPSFNKLNVFSVPKDHAVSYVTPLAQGSRFSITGWLRHY